MASGVGINDSCVTTFQDLMRRKHKYIIFDLNKNLTEVVVAKTSSDVNYEAFIADLPPSECKWAVYDFEFQHDDGGRRNKVLFISWAPDGAKIKQKMIFASSKDALRNSLGLATEIQGTDLDEVEYETVLEKVRRLR